jgi:hypothetical protein
MITTRIKGLDRRLMPIGRIRFGDRQGTSKAGKTGTMQMLERPRMTSSDQPLLERAATLYGGTVRPWLNAPPGPRQWELYIEADAVPIIIPPIEALSQCYEVWSAKGCLRRCNGEQITHAYDLKEVGQPCVCPTDVDERIALANEGKACKLTTRISCMLPDLPGIGLWVIETHSYYASLWTAGMVELLETLAKQGRICEAMLRIERQTRKGRHGTRNFAIPAIVPHELTPRQLFAPELHQALHPGETLPMLPAAPPAPLEDNIALLYGDPTPVDSRTGRLIDASSAQGPSSVRADVFEVVARLEAAVAAQGGDAHAIEGWKLWAEQKLGKGRAEFTLADWQRLHAAVQAHAEKRTADEVATVVEVSVDHDGASPDE